MVLNDHLCAVFQRSALKNRTPTKESTAVPEHVEGLPKAKTPTA
jgi:hypothetical protein